MVMQVQVVPFGQITDITGSETFPMNAASTGELRTLLEEKYPQLKSKKFAIAVNKQLIKGDMELPQQAEVALLPPFSGG